MSEYLAWYDRTKDFSSVERRKKLVKTPKVYLLYLFAFAIVIAALAFTYYAMLFADLDFRIIVLACVVFLLPYFLAYAILIPLALVKLAQIPAELFLTAQARKKLSSHKALKIAISGSFGKTSMREILKTVLSEGKKVASPPFSYNTPLGICRFINQLKGDEEVLIFELGEYYPGDVAKLCELIDPHVGIITGVNEAHLERFGTLQKTANTIFELADYLKKKPVYINGENEISRKKANTTLRNHIVYTRGGAGDILIQNAKSNLSGTIFRLQIGNDTFSVKSGLLGLHNVGPLAVSAHIAHRLGFDKKQIEEGIGKTRAFSHRMEPKEDKSGITTIDDSYNGNPDGASAIIEFLSSLKGRRRWYVTPGLVEMGPRTFEVHKEIGKKLAQAGIEKVVLIRNSVTQFIEQGLKEAQYKGEILWYEDALVAFAALPHLTVKGDVVLLQNDWPDQYV
ncbi:MAG: UDP-N-acetylmuramoyl-tripeptide--D-alanyl-D-alanine ligase [bacterium]|nr:UDP-N-acetylmuramoyl-tripeptide--D-alanyl-D-alanine ligase [bacterium]